MINSSRSNSKFGICGQQPKPWANKLLAIACFSLAAKMLKVEYSPTDVQVKRFAL